MQVETKEFWKRVKSEFNPPEQMFLCSSSTFYLKWHIISQRDIIQELAWEYLRNTETHGLIGDKKLFINTHDGSIRSKFIDYMINKFS